MVGDVERDAARVEWNEALASGDPERIEATQDKLLTRIHERIMDDDPNYVIGGWTPTP